MPREIYNKNAREKALMEEAYAQVNEGRGHSPPVPDWEKQAGLEKELAANRKAARRDPHRHVDAEMRRRAPSEVWKSMPPGERDKLGKKSEDAEMWDGPGMQHDEPLASRDIPDPTALEAFTSIISQIDDETKGKLIRATSHHENAGPVFVALQNALGGQGGDERPLGRAAALRKEPGTGKDRLFYK